MVSKEAVLWRRSQDTSLQWVERHAMSSTMYQLKLKRRKALTRLLNIHPITPDRLIQLGKLNLNPVKVEQLVKFNEDKVLLLTLTEATK